MHRITLIQHSDWVKSCIYHPEAISWENVAYISYPTITTETLEELKTANMKRVQEILSSLTNLWNTEYFTEKT